MLGMMQLIGDPTRFEVPSFFFPVPSQGPLVLVLGSAERCAMV